MNTTTTIAVPTSCAVLCTKLAELTQRIEDELAQAGNGAALDYGALEQRVADALGEVERGLLAMPALAPAVPYDEIRSTSHARAASPSSGTGSISPMSIDTTLAPSRPVAPRRSAA